MAVVKWWIRVMLFVLAVCSIALFAWPFIFTNGDRPAHTGEPSAEVRAALISDDLDFLMSEEEILERIIWTGSIVVEMHRSPMVATILVNVAGSISESDAERACYEYL